MEGLEHERCPTCDAKLTGRWERLTPGLCRTLVKFYEIATARRTNELHLQRDCVLTKNEYTNFYKLRYFGLVSNGSEQGFYKLTPDGERFVRSEIRCVTKVFVFRNEVQEIGDETQRIAEIMAEPPYWEMKDYYVAASAPVEAGGQARLF